MSRSTAERLMTHVLVATVFAVFIYLYLLAAPVLTGPDSRPPEPTLGIAPQPPAAAPAYDAAPTVVPSPSPAPSRSGEPHRTRKVGLQVGHLLTDEVPDELEGLRGVWGVTSGDLDEVVISQQIAERVAQMLADAGVESDILPSTVPEKYHADLFLSLHVDAYKSDEMRGFKVARSDWSQDPKRDDELVADLVSRYSEATGFPEHVDTITDNMTQYYAFNYSKYRHSISPETPAAIMELGFLSNQEDVRILVDNQPLAARGLVNAILDFLKAAP